MTRTVQFPQPTGIITMTIRDAETMEIKRTQREENAISEYGLSALVGLAGSRIGLGAQPSFGVNIGAYTIILNDRITSAGLMGAGVGTPGRAPSVYVAGGLLSAWDFTEGSPDFTQMTQRFLQPVTDRTINTIQLRGGDADNTFSSASLSTPCIQTTSEILDVTYRIQFFYQTPDPLGLPVAFDYGRVIARKVAGRGVGSIAPQLGGFPQDSTTYWHGVPPTGVYEGLTPAAGFLHEVIAQNQSVFDHGKLEFNMDKSISEENGRVFKTVGFGSTPNSALNWMDATSTIGFGPGTGHRTIAWAPIAPSSFPNKPIQPIHNHASTANEWGLDVDNLSTGQGTLTVDGSSWTDPGYPEFYRIDHSVTGQVGASRYSFRTRRSVGFNGNSYLPRSDSWISQLWEMKAADVDGKLYQTIPGGHGLKDHFRCEEYDDQTYMNWNTSGFQLTNITNCVFALFDANSTPALPVTNLRQIAVDGSGNVWAACGNTGLYKIADPFGSPVVTHMTVATNTIVAGGEDNAYGVSVGFGGDIFALVEGGLISTSNPTDATPLFLTESFTFTGISNALWSRVQYMRVDRNHPDNQLALIYASTDSPSTTVTAVWWSTAATPGITGPVQIGGTRWDNNPATYETTMLYDVSHIGGHWIFKGPTWSRANAQTMTFGTATLKKLGTATVGDNGRPAFCYDYYDTPHTISQGEVSVGPSVWSSRGKNYATTSGFTANFSTYLSYGIAFQSGLGKNLWMMAADAANSNPQVFGQGRANYLRHLADANYTDPLNGQHSPLEEMYWDRYHWNGAAWELNYFADALDTGGQVGGPYPGSRENFDTEDHTFTGRSMIDVTAAFATGNFAASAIATFAFKLIPEAKISTANDDDATKQERPRVLLDVSDATQQFQIVWDDSIQGNIQIVEDGSATTIASTPANSSTYRLIVIVNGTSVDVYLDDAQIGSTVTLSNAFDWSNGSSDLKAFLGCEVYAWEFPQRYAPWQNNFYRGVMENVQIWNSAWAVADVNSDFLNIDGSIAGGTEPAVNQIARFELTQSLSTLETKLSHASVDALNEGITIAFVNGASPDAFVATDYHTFAVVDGIFKDNATAFTQQYSIYIKPVDLDFADFKNSSGTSLIEASTTAIVDEVAKWTAVNPAVDAPRNITSDTNTGLKEIWAVPGQVASSNIKSASHTTVDGANTIQHISGDGYFQCGPGCANEGALFGFSTAVSTNHTATLIPFGIKLNPDGTVDIVESNVTVSLAVATYAVGDSFRVRRIGTAVTYYKVVLGVPTLLYTSGNTSSGDLYGNVSLLEEGYQIRDAVITYTLPTLVMTIGNPVGSTGIFDPDFFRVETRTPESISIDLAGSPATVVISDTYFSAMTIPAPGEVVVNGISGWLSFNVADVGKAVTGNVTVIYQKY